jgi:hypothetical protein
MVSQRSKVMALSLVAKISPYGEARPEASGRAGGRQPSAVDGRVERAALHMRNLLAAGPV